MEIKSEVVDLADDDDGVDQDLAKQQWEAPKLSYVKPELREEGSLMKVTGGFFGTFSP